MSNEYPAAPPSYEQAPKKYASTAETRPLFNAGEGSSNGIYNQADGDIDDFLYGSSAWESAAEIKNGGSGFWSALNDTLNLNVVLYSIHQEGMTMMRRRAAAVARGALTTI